MTTALVTGASGYLAHRLLPITAKHAKVTGVCRNPSPQASDQVTWLPLDITDARATQETIHNLKPDVIIHAAAANPGQNEDAMWAVNCDATKTIAVIAGDLDIRLLFVSTDIVHNGLLAPYADNAIASPLNTYGKSKTAGEEAALSNCKRAIVARTSLIYGLEQIDRGTHGFKNTLASGDELTLFDDVMRQPVWIDSLCHAICSLAFERTTETGTINLAGNQSISRADFAIKMLHYWNVPIDTNIKLASGQSIPGLPLDCTMQLHRAKALGIELPGVDTVLSNAE